MNVDLRPMSMGEILDRTFQIYRARFWSFLGIAALPALASLVLSLAFFLVDEYGPNTTLSGPSKLAFRDFASWLPREWPYSFFRCLMWPVFAYLTSRIFLDEKPTFTSALFWFKARWQACLALASILWAIWILVPSLLDRLLWRSGLASGHMINGAGDLSRFFPIQSIFYLINWVITYLAILILAFSVPVWSLEGQGMRPALQRGLSFAKRNWPRVFVSWLLVNVLEWILFATFWGLFLLALRLIFGDSDGGQYYKLRFTLSIPAAHVISILVAPLLPIPITLIYYDQRIRFEGYDIERMMEAAGLNAVGSLPSGDGLAAPAGAGEGQA